MYNIKKVKKLGDMYKGKILWIETNFIEYIIIKLLIDKIKGPLYVSGPYFVV